MIKFLFITNQPDVAAFACANGADRIFVDLEINGKQERQGHLDTVISRHQLSDVAVVRPHVPAGRLLVRINPVHEGTQAEVDAVIAAGADILMLPMFRGPAQVEAFARAVRGRARTMLLVETVDAMRSLAECLRVDGVDEVHIGLNDLHLELRLHFMFETLALGLVDEMARVVHERGLPLGVGGVARVGEGMLPAELLMSEHVRLGSTGAILSRTFHRQARTVAEIREQMDFAAEVGHLRAAYAHYASIDRSELQAVHRDVCGRIEGIARGIAERKAARSAPAA